MFAQRGARFELLETRVALAVSAEVIEGDLVVTGDADGAVEILAIGAGEYQVTDNGVVLPVTLTGVTDDIRINIDETAGADNSVVLNLVDQTVDRIFADLGDGTNSMQVTATTGTAARFDYRGGSGADDVALSAPVTGMANVKLGNGENTFDVNSTVGRLEVKGGSSEDIVNVNADVAGNASVYLGGGDNEFSLTAAVDGYLHVVGGGGADTATLAAGSSVGESAKLDLGHGNNIATVAGTIAESLYYEGRDGDDSLAIAATAAITDDLYAKLGGGDNTVTHDGNIGGDFNVVSKNIDDSVVIATTAVIGGEQNIGLGEQSDRGGYCGRGRGGGRHRGR